MGSERDQSKIRIHVRGFDLLRAAFTTTFTLGELRESGYVEISNSEILGIYGSANHPNSALKIEFDNEGKRCSLRVPGGTKENQILRLIAGSKLKSPSQSFKEMIPVYLRSSPTLYSLAAIMLAFWFASFFTPTEGYFISSTCSDKCSDSVSRVVSGLLFLIPAILIPSAILGLALLKFLPSIRIQTVRSALITETYMLIFVMTATVSYLAPKLYEQRSIYQIAYLKINAEK